MPVKLTINGTVVFNGWITIDGISNPYTAKSGSFIIERPANDNVAIYPSMYVNWRYRMPWWSNSQKTSNETVSSDFFWNFKQLVGPSIISANRISDKQINLSWIGANDMVSHYQLERSTNGGSWSVIESKLATNTYSDTTTNEDSFYKYRVSASDDVVSTNPIESSVIYTSPKAPDSLSGIRTTATDINFTVENTSTVATGLEVEKSTDRSTWSSVGTYEGLITAFSYDSAGTTYYYRCRNTRGSLASSWTETTDAIQTITNPEKPVWEPRSQYYDHNKFVGNVAYFSYSCADGSPKKAHQTRAYVPATNTEYATINGSGKGTFVGLRTVSAGMNYGDQIKLEVRTQSQQDAWSEWSEPLILTSVKSPTVSISAESTIESFPYSANIIVEDNEYLDWYIYVVESQYGNLSNEEYKEKSISTNHNITTVNWEGPLAGGAK